MANQEIQYGVQDGHQTQNLHEFTIFGSID